MIKFEDFQKLEIKIGKVLSAERIKGSDKLIKLEVDLGQEIRQIVAGMAQFYEPDYFLNKELVILANLEPRKLIVSGTLSILDVLPTIRSRMLHISGGVPPAMGVESQGMVLAADVQGKPIILIPDKQAPPGSIVR